LIPNTKHLSSFDIFNEIPKIKFELDPRITFLGTISMKPNSYNCASSIHLNLDGKGVLFDCGEGTFGQMVDHYDEA